jgi:hypothetical protein
MPQTAIAASANPEPTFTAITIPRVGTQWAEHGGIYAGIMRGETGQPDYHLILVEGDIAANWTKAKEWAATINAELPTRREQSLLFANLKDRFNRDWYWSGEQGADDDGYAWLQDFSDGNQSYSLSRKAYEYRARAVRRFLIIQ